MIRRFSIVIDPIDASPLYLGGDAEAAKLIVRERKSEGKAVAAWINVRPEKRFAPSLAPTPTPEPIEDEIDIPEDDDIEALKELAAGDKRRADVKEAIAKLEELGVK